MRWSRTREASSSSTARISLSTNQLRRKILEKHLHAEECSTPFGYLRVFWPFSMHFQQNNRIVTVFENGYLGRWRLQQQNETSLVVFRLWRKSKDAGDLFCTFSSLSPRPIIRDPNNRKLRGPIMILKCTTAQDWHLAVRETRWKIWFFANCVVALWILVLKFILITLSVAICEICSQEEGDEGNVE